MDNLEYCFKCDEPTGCAGRADDSHYNEDGEGPFCWRCWCEDENPRLNDLIDSQQSALADAKEIRESIIASNKMICDANDRCIAAKDKRIEKLKAEIEYLQQYVPQPKHCGGGS